jgi:hypothetical protein
MDNIGKLGIEVYKILAAKDYGYSITLYDADSENTTTPLNAKWFYIKPVNFMVQLPDDNSARPEMYFWKTEGEHDKKIESLIKRLRRSANQFSIGLTVNDFSKENTPKTFAKLVKRHNDEQELQEGYSGSSMRSYYTLPKSKMVIVHNKKVQEDIRGSRSRNIKAIYLESNGERYKFPCNNTSSAKAMAQHLNNGGIWTDNVGTTIKESHNEVQLYKKLIAECFVLENAPLLLRAKTYISEIKSDIKRMHGPRGYKAVCEKLNSLPKVSKQLIEARSRALMAACGLTESEELLEVYKAFAKRDAISDKLNENSFSNIISSSMQKKPSIESAKAARLITGDKLGFNAEFKLPFEPQDTMTKVIAYADAMAKIIDNDLISVALNEISEKHEPTIEEAQFVAAVYKSAKLNQKHNTTPEIQQLMDWIEKE